MAGSGKDSQEHLPPKGSKSRLKFFEFRAEKEDVNTFKMF